MRRKRKRGTVGLGSRLHRTMDDYTQNLFFEGTVRGGSVSVTRKDAANSNDAGFGDERICFEVPGVRNRVALFPIWFCYSVRRVRDVSVEVALFTCFVSDSISRITSARALRFL